MTLKKAIEILTIELSAWPHKGTEDWYDSVKLGIEALKFLQQYRTFINSEVLSLLSGETEE